MRNRLFSLLLALSLLPCAALGESLTLDEMNAAEDATPLSAAEAAQPVESAARADFIDRILALAETLYAKADGQPQRAQYSGDIYVCKNYTVHLFRETCGDFRMAEYPDVPLVIPNNQKKADCAPYVYGVEWQDVPASEGNPFYAAASFRYDDTLSKAENRENAREFLKHRFSAATISRWPRIITTAWARTACSSSPITTRRRTASTGRIPT